MILKSIREIKEINNIIMSIRNLFNDPVILKNLEKMNLTREAMKNAVENTKNTVAALDQTGILYESKQVILASKKRINLHDNAQNLGKLSNVAIGLAKSFRELINELKFEL
jgi:predicted  nucleic acid-binding Zn-ribbon protein